MTARGVMEMQKEKIKKQPTIEDVIDWKTERICDDCRNFFQEVDDEEDIGICMHDKKTHKPDETCKYFCN